MYRLYIARDGSNRTGIKKKINKKIKTRPLKRRSRSSRSYNENVLLISRRVLYSLSWTLRGTSQTAAVGHVRRNKTHICITVYYVVSCATYTRCAFLFIRLSFARAIRRTGRASVVTFRACASRYVSPAGP